MLCSTNYTLCQTTEVDGENEIECSTSRTLEFEISADVNGDDVDDVTSVLVRITERDGNVVLDCRKFKASEDTAKRYGEWFVNLLNEDNDLAYEIDCLLRDERQSQVDGDGDLAWKNRDNF